MSDFLKVPLKNLYVNSLFKKLLLFHKLINRLFHIFIIYNLLMDNVSLIKRFNNYSCFVSDKKKLLQF